MVRERGKAASDKEFLKLTFKFYCEIISPLKYWILARTGKLEKALGYFACQLLIQKQTVCVSSFIQTV